MMPVVIILQSLINNQDNFEQHSSISWVKRFILFHDKRHPKAMGAAEIRAFLSSLATHEHVAASTQNGALNALLFLYRSVLQQPCPHLEQIERAKRPRRLPTVFTRDEVHGILTRLTGMPHLMASLLYGAGLRLMECVRLRVKDVDFTYHQSPCAMERGPRTGSPCSPCRWKSPCSGICYTTLVPKRRPMGVFTPVIARAALAMFHSGENLALGGTVALQLASSSADANITGSSSNWNPLFGKSLKLRPVRGSRAPTR